jgi:HTH-type transcriptional regulator/antitoxin HipB
MKAHISTSGQLGPILKHLRLEKGLSQAELGNSIGLSQERISKIENQPEKVNLDQILTLLMALDATLSIEPRTLPQGSAKIDSAIGADLPTPGKESW